MPDSEIRYPKPADYSPELIFPANHPRYASLARCHAWNRRQGRQCAKLAMKGLQVCREHGGASKRGVAHPNYRGRGYSKYLPKNLKGAHDAWRDDPRRKSLENEIDVTRAIASSRFVELQRKAAPSWEAAAILHKKASLAINAGRLKEASELLSKLGVLLNTGKDQAQAQDGILNTFEGLRRLVDTQRQMEVDQGEYLQRGVAIMLMTEILVTLREKLAGVEGGGEILQAVGERVRGLLTAPNADIR